MQMSPVPRDDPVTPRPAKRKVDKGKNPADDFPAPSPLSSQPSRSLLQTSSLAAYDFPAPSPLTSPASSREKPSQKKHSKSEVKLRNRTVISSSEHTSSSDEDAPPQVRPFPMETQMLASISDSPLKRTSEDDDLGIHRHKRTKRQGHEILHELMDSDDDDELRFLNPDVDHSTLCPWCDEVLPPTPSPHLQNLINSARKRSYHDPRPTNPLGLRAPLTVFIAVCQRHTFERVHIPLAQRNGWPMSIQWEELGHRILQLKRVLKRIVDDVDEEWLPGHVRSEDEEEVKVEEDEEVQQQRPRKGSTFWKDVIKSVKSHGSRQAIGVRNQFSNFTKTQPGYYGELGYVIIHQTIYDLFPPASFDSDSTLPLSPTEFIQLILVPEAAVSLIMDDLQQPRAQAIQTLRASAEYGVAMFPDEQNDTGGSNVGENIVRERAKARRKVLEAEGETNQDSGDDDVVVVVSPKKKRGRPRKKDADRPEDSDIAMSTDASRSGVPKPRPRRKKRNSGDAPPSIAPSSKPNSKSAPTEVLDLCDSTDTMTVSTTQEGHRPRPKPRRRARPQNTDGHRSHTDMSDYTEPEVNVPRPEPIVVDLDVEETPRPAKVGRMPSGMASSMLSLHGDTVQDTANRKLTPLEIARQRKEQKGKPSSDGWARTLREPLEDSDDNMQSDASRASKASRRGRSQRS
ncbi:hypothetical protein QCA50_008981 [Cerrena zonata]|uniref:Restriction of telomere capping protein 4 n=1 Tax=Cerrena zonata TaxID=2478898 RepID=A0AAW0GCV6_9APHY